MCIGFSSRYLFGLADWLIHLANISIFNGYSQRRNERTKNKNLCINFDDKRALYLMFGHAIIFGVVRIFRWFSSVCDTYFGCCSMWLTSWPFSHPSNRIWFSCKRRRMRQIGKLDVILWLRVNGHTDQWSDSTQNVSAHWRRATEKETTKKKSK